MITAGDWSGRVGRSEPLAANDGASGAYRVPRRVRDVFSLRNRSGQKSAAEQSDEVKE
jgi:hypothetical protein